MPRISLRRSVLFAALTALTSLGLPGPASAATSFVAASIDAGMGYHTCALTRSGEAYCWGFNNNGQLGDGTTDSSMYDGPRRVIGGLRFRTISAGTAHTCALTFRGEAYCWGLNGNGELGDGTTDDSAEDGPQEVIGGLRFSTIDAGDFMTCGLTARGVAYCWGYNYYGQLGDGTTDDSAEDGPQRVMGGLRFRAIASGEYHTCGITHRGDAYCWGNNTYGALGDGTSDDSSADGPQAVTGGLRFTSISAGYYFSCGIVVGGAAYCWGYNTYGEVGDGTVASTYADGPQAVIGGLRFRTIDTGWYLTCGTTYAGESYCWGYNGFGELGDGTNDDSAGSGPQPIIGDHRFVSVDAGGYHTCGMTAAGAAYCWGYGAYGQVGDGTDNNSDAAGPQRAIAGDS